MTTVLALNYESYNDLVLIITKQSILHLAETDEEISKTLQIWESNDTKKNYSIVFLKN